MLVLHWIDKTTPGETDLIRAEVTSAIVRKQWQNSYNVDKPNRSDHPPALSKEIESSRFSCPTWLTKKVWIVGGTILAISIIAAIVIPLAIKFGRITTTTTAPVYLAYWAFDNSADDLYVGSTALVVNSWYHVAFVYNYETSQQIIYLDGVQYASQSTSTTYLGTNGTMYFGYTPLLPLSFFSGHIDNAQLTTRAKSAAEILVDATQVFYYSFDQPSPYSDNGPNRLNVTIQDVISSFGIVGQGVRFTTTSSSYVQINSWPFSGWPTNKPFTFAMWIYATSVSGGGLIFNPPNGISLLGLTYNGQIVAQLQSPANVWQAVIGSFIPVNTWRHVACTFSVTNGLTLYVNGVSQGSISGILTYYWTSSLYYIYLGYCNGQAYIVTGGSFQGTVDEFYAYRRELSVSEIFTLATI
ncbi:unnamed protein product [Didymodactylos carnosus]|uniref:LamG domain-containing protein n=1 Tax=Didymodactylos carnosus TaxID=1234261 RepID=A0A814U9N3_9BILA|nr:unnamed protein product [Didymodactylos carnosus]CAF1172292.1 unnamed protein product [Didymodactylos carnosus]CAF3636448.1 unnamed protein product [Didymodactylos carnosus]CAF3936208.1 unnamed protein product [Didymodactylos carnosus]